MSFPIPDLNEVRSRVAARMSAQLPSFVDLSLSDKPSVLRIISDTIAGESYGLHLMANSIIDQLFPNTASNDNLDRLAISNGIYRLPGTKASGVVNVRYVGESPIRLGPGWNFSANGVTFVPSYDFTTIALNKNDSTDLTLIATSNGIIGNLSEDITLVASSGDAIYTDELIVTIRDSFSGGRDRETDAELRSRLILRRNPSYGSIADYTNWAKEEGALRAWSYVNDYAPGWITVLFEDVINERPPGISDPLVPTGRYLQLQFNLQSRAPGDVRVYVRSPDYSEVYVKLNFDSLAYLRSQQKEDIIKELADFETTVIPGGSYYNSQILAAVSNVGLVYPISVDLYSKGVKLKAGRQTLPKYSLLKLSIDDDSYVEVGS